MQDKKSLRKAGITRLHLPVFFDKSVPDHISLKENDVICGQAIYGDTSKRTGLSNAMIYAEKHNLNLRVIELAVSINNDFTIYNRVTRQIVESGETDFLVLNKARRSFMEEMLEEIAATGKSRYPHRTQTNGLDWLKTNPELGRIIFDQFPAINTVVIWSQQPYSPPLLSFALLRSTSRIIESRVLYNSKMTVKIE